MNNQVEGHVKPKIYVVLVNKTELAFREPLVKGSQLLKEAGLEPTQCHTLYLKSKGCDFEKVHMDDVVDLSNEGIEHFVTKGADLFNYEVNGEPETTDKRELTPEQILKLKGVNAQDFYLVQLLPDGECINYAFKTNEPIKMVCTEMKFITEKWLDIVNIEEYGKQCKPVPPARIYKVKIDKNYYDWPKPSINIFELINLELPHNTKPVEVYKFLNTTPKPIKLKPGELVDLTEKCLVRFTIQPKEQEDGLQTNPLLIAKTQLEDVEDEVKLRRDFSLPQEDIEFLDNLGVPWEAIGNQPSMWVLIKDYPIPEGYNVAKAEVALLITPTYPATEIDMAYFMPPLIKNSGRTIKNLLEQALDGRKFQGWSRHRKVGEWRPGVDSIQTHLCLVDNWLIRDLER